LASIEEAGVRAVERRFEAGETIYVCGDSDRYLYVVTEGVVKLYKGYGEHKEAIVTLLEKDSAFGEPTPLLVDVHRDSAEAASACWVTLVGKEALAQHVQRDPMCALALIVAYAQWVQRNERAMEDGAPDPARYPAPVSGLAIGAG
jgi:CRP-like cAMP-binding protein